MSAIIIDGFRQLVITSSKSTNKQTNLNFYLTILSSHYIVRKIKRKQSPKLVCGKTHLRMVTKC